MRFDAAPAGAADQLLPTVGAQPLPPSRNRKQAVVRWICLGCADGARHFLCGDCLVVLGLHQSFSKHGQDMNQSFLVKNRFRELMMSTAGSHHAAASKGPTSASRTAREERAAAASGVGRALLIAGVVAAVLLYFLATVVLPAWEDNVKSAVTAAAEAVPTVNASSTPGKAVASFVEWVKGVVLEGLK